MNQVKTFRGLVLGLLVLLMAGMGLPALAQQGPWTVTFGSGDINAANDKDFGGATLPAGHYKLEYISGAIDYWVDSPDDDDYGLTAGDAGAHWPVTHSTNTVIDGPHDGGLKVKTVAEIEQKVSGASISFNHDGTSDISIGFRDDPYDNTLGAAVVWRLTLVAEADKVDLIINDPDLEMTKGAYELPIAENVDSNGANTDSKVPVLAQIPADLTDGDVSLDFNLPEGVVFYDEDGTTKITTFPITWDIGTTGKTSRTFYIEARSSFSKEPMTLLVQNPEKSTGPVTLDPYEDQESVFAGGCSSCASSSCPTGSGSEGSNACLEFRAGLGNFNFSGDAGYLLIHADTPSASLSTPASLGAMLSGGIAGNLVEDGDKLTPSSSDYDEWGEAELNVIDDYEYEIIFRVDIGGAMTEYRKIRVHNPDESATTFNRLYIYETITLPGQTAQTQFWYYEYTAGTGDDGIWELKEGSYDTATSTATVLKITEREQSWNGSEVTETITVKEADDTTVVSKTEEVWKEFDWGRELISKTMDPDTTAADQQLKEVWTYYDDAANDGDNYGRLESYLSETGYWERYEYDADGNVSKTMRQHEDEVLNTATAFATAAADNIVEEYTEDDSVPITGYTNDVRVEKWQIKVEGTVERTWYMVYVDEVDSDISGCTAEWSARPVTADPENGTTLAAVIEDVLDGTDTTSLVTKIWRWEEGATGIGDNDPYDTRAMQSPDGQVTVYERTINTDQQTNVVKRGFSDDALADILSGAGGADIEYGTKTTSVVDTRGNMVSTKTEKISESDNSGDWFITSLMKADVTDDFGRPTVTEYFFGEEAADEVATPGSGVAAYDTTVTYGCCGGGSEEIRAGRDGVESRTADDILGRTSYTKRWHGITGIDPLYSVNEYDAAGRVIASGLSTDNDLDDAEDLKSQRTYDKAGRMDSATDEEGRKSYMTYRRVTTSGGTYAGTGVFYWEARGYGNDDDAPVSVTWTDSHGRTVLSYTGSGTWAGTPTGTETLAEHTRSTSVYDWDNRMTEGRAYFDIASLAKDAPGIQGTNYLVTGVSEYDALGRGFRSTDAAGNITEMVYEDGTGRSIKTLIGVDVNDLHTVSRVYYNKFVSGNPTGDDRPWPTRVYTVKPGLTAAPDDSDLDDSSPTFTDYVYTQTVEVHGVDSAKDYMIARRMWSRPEFGPWTNTAYDDQGRFDYQTTSENDNGSAGDILSVGPIQDYDSLGRAFRVRRKPVTNGVYNGNHLRANTYFDDASRPVKVETIGRGYTKTEYDDYGRTKRTVFASDEGANTDADAFTDDIVLTESVPTYDKSGRVTGTVTYERAHDATATGLLSAAAADQSRTSYSYTWFDDNGRSAHNANVGTDSAYTYVAGTPPTPNTSDDVLVSKVEYDAPGRAYLRTDNLGRQTRTFFDDLGRAEHVVQNWDGSLTTPDSPGSRDADLNRITKNVYDNSATGGGARIETVAIDPDHNGNTSDNQSTLYIHSGEVLPGERGPIPVNGRPLAILMPDAVEDGTTRANVIAEINSGGEVFGDFSFTSYYANGQVEQSTDQRGVQKNLFYTDEGWADYTTVTEATGNTWDSIGDLRTAYTYGGAGEVLTITTYDVATGGSSNETSKLTYTYDGFYNRLTEKQDHDPTANGGAGDPKTISWAYDTTLSGNIYTKAYRLKTTTYPNGRVIHNTYDGHSGIDDAISRANAVAEDPPGSPGTPGSDIASYSFLGSGRMVIKDLPTPDIKLDYFAPGSGVAGTSGTYAGLDAFGRIKAQQWIDYAGTEFDVLHIKHGYDRNSNKLYDDRQVYKSYSSVHGRDELDRLTTFDQGLIKSDQSAIEDHWITRTQHFGYDQLGNPLTVKEYTNDTSADAFSEITALSAANEIDSVKIMGERGKPPLVEDTFDTDTSANYEVSNDDGDAFSVSSSALTVTNLGTDGETILLIGESIGAHAAYINIEFPNESGGEAGYVFGYTGPDDYYLCIVDTQNNRRRFYRVENGSRTLLDSTNWTIGTSEQMQFSAMLGSWIQQTYASEYLSAGIPSGRVGLYTSQADVAFKHLAVWSEGRRPEMAGRWRPSGQTNSGSTRNQINTSSDVLKVSDWISGRTAHPTVLEGVRADRFEVTYQAKGGQWGGTYLAFNNRVPNAFKAFRTLLHNSGDEFRTVQGKSTAVSSSSGPGSNPWSNAQKWVRVTNDGTTVSAQVSNSASEPSDWSTVAVIRSTTNLDAFGGLLGFGADANLIDVDDVTIKTDRDGNGTYETTEYEGDFTLDGDGYREEDLVHDAAGNLTYDGRYAYTYDAFNRLHEVQIAYYAPGETTLSYGSVINEMRYDGVNRRIVKAVKNSADLDCTYHYYLNGQSCIEERDGSDNVIRQNVWGLMYIDELISTSLNDDPSDTGEQDVETHYFALHDTQFNILAITEDDGDVKEHYEYTPYGERRVLISAGDDDTTCLTPFYISNRMYVSSVEQPYGRNPFGFQGLHHDEASGLIYNRARMLNARLKRFNQRDPLGYPDGMNSYAAYHVMRGTLDPWGLHEFEESEDNLPYSRQADWDASMKTHNSGTDLTLFRLGWIQRKADHAVSGGYITGRDDAAAMLNHFLEGNGGWWKVPMEELMSEDNPSSVRAASIINDALKHAEGLDLEEGETIIFRSTKVEGVRSGGLNWHYGLGTYDAWMRAKVNCNSDGTLTMIINYRLYDFYDWDIGNGLGAGPVSDWEMGMLHRSPTSDAQEYPVTGSVFKSLTWKPGERIQKWSDLSDIKASVPEEPVNEPAGNTGPSDSGGRDRSGPMRDGYNEHVRDHRRSADPKRR